MTLIGNNIPLARSFPYVADVNSAITRSYYKSNI